MRPEPAPRPMGVNRRYGKFRGTVVDNRDKTRSGRLKVSVPDALGTVEVWAAPCVPYAAAGLGVFLMPPRLSVVWVEFAAGELDQPIWTGVEWPEGQAPSGNPDEMVIATPSGTLRFNAANTQGEVVLETGSLSLTLKGNTVTLRASQTAVVELSGKRTTINGNGLEVT